MTFRKDGTYAVTREGGHERLSTQQVSVLECDSCHDRIVVIEDQLHDGSRAKQAGRITWEGIHWWPVPGSAGSHHPAVPGSVAGSYAEGTRCLSVNAPNGAVAMFRTAMTWIVEDRGSDVAKAKSDLKDKVQQMVRDGGLTDTLGDWVDHVRLYGNARVHLDKFGDVSIEEAREVAGLVETLIDLIYVMPATIAERKAQRRPES